MIIQKSLTFLLFLWIAANGISQQNVGINVEAPTQALSVDRGLNIDNNNQNNGNTLLNGLRFGNTDVNNQMAGITSNRTGVDPYSLDFYTGNSRRMMITQTGRVGIGKLPETYALEVQGTLEASIIRSAGNMFANGSIAADDNITAGINLIAGSNLFVGANINAGANIFAGDNLIAQNDINSYEGDIIAPNGELKAGGRGVVMSNSDARLKVIAYTVTVTVTNLGSGNSVTRNLNITGGNFTANPTAYVGNVITSNGEYYRAMVVIEDVSTTNITLRIVNFHTNPISFSGAQWRILALGAY